MKTLNKIKELLTKKRDKVKYVINSDIKNDEGFTYTEFKHIQKEWNRLIKYYNKHYVYNNYYSKYDVQKCLINIEMDMGEDYDLTHTYKLDDLIKDEYFHNYPDIYHVGRNPVHYNLKLRKYIIENITEEELSIMLFDIKHKFVKQRPYNKYNIRQNYNAYLETIYNEDYYDFYSTEEGRNDRNSKEAIITKYINQFYESDMENYRVVYKENENISILEPDKIGE